MRNALIAVTVLLGAAGLALADAGDPPSRVARLNYQNGNVSLRPAGMDKWTAAMLNDPLAGGDHLWAGPGARAELHIGSTAIRVGSETSLGVFNIDDRTVQLSVTQGSVQIRLRSLDEGETFEVDTPNAAIWLLREGEYRVDANTNGDVTYLVVRAGEAEVTPVGGTAFQVRPHEAVRLRGIDNAASEMSYGGNLDEWDRWCQARDQREDRVESARYVGREMTGYEDLDHYGTWRNAPGYGWVWVPSGMGPDWAPYRYGHWRFIEPWGWTWIDYAPWGFAPFHYGRWAYMGGWVWVPGAMVRRPVYAPALVAWVGGPNVGVSIAVGGGSGVGWFPLGPREMYRPGYHASEMYARRMNGDFVSVTYVNRTVIGGVTFVSHETFVSAAPVHRGVMRISERDVMRAQVVMVPPVAPRHGSMVIRPVAGPPVHVVSRTVVVRSAPPPAPVGFAMRERMYQSNPGRPIGVAGMNSLRGPSGGARPDVRRVADAPSQRQSQPPGSWRRYEPSGSRPAAGPGDRMRPAERPAQQVPRQAERPVQPPRQVEQRPIQQPRQVEQRPIQQPRQAERPVQQPRQMEQRPVQQPRQVEQRPVQQPRQMERAPDRPARQAERPAEVRREPRGDQRQTQRSADRPAERKTSERKAEERKRDEHRPPQ